MKRISVFLLSVLVCISLAAVPVQAEEILELSVSDAQCVAGGSAEFTVSVTHNPGISFLSIAILCDAPVTVNNHVNGSVFPGMTVGKQCVWVNAGNITACGTLLTFTVSAEEATAPQNYPVSIRINECYNTNEMEVATHVTAGTLTVTGHTNQWLKDDGGWYYVDGKGNRVINRWMRDSIGWCYLGTDGYCMMNAWVMDSVSWCYLGADGYCVTNAWVADSIGLCYLDANGRMVTNAWVMDSVGWCYVGAHGYCVTNAWVADSIGWCYLDADGRMVTNAWVMDSVGWCYIGVDGYCLQNTWLHDGTGICYLDADGRMIIGRTVFVDGSWRTFDENGYCTL